MTELVAISSMENAELAQFVDGIAQASQAVAVALLLAPFLRGLRGTSPAGNTAVNLPE